MTTHALIIPQPINALRTWCGIGYSDPRADDSYFAFSPDAVTCEPCKRNMRDGLKNLLEWVPQLKDSEES